MCSKLRFNFAREISVCTILHAARVFVESFHDFSRSSTCSDLWASVEEKTAKNSDADKVSLVDKPRKSVTTLLAAVGCVLICDSVCGCLHARRIHQWLSIRGKRRIRRVYPMFRNGLRLQRVCNDWRDYFLYMPWDWRVRERNGSLRIGDGI